MAQLINIGDRRILPLWKGFSDSIPELKNRKSDPSKPGDISAFVEDWRNEPNIANAGDLIGAAITQNNTEDTYVKEAVSYVLNHKDSSTIPLYDVASRLKGIEPSSIETIAEMTLAQRIARLKLYLHDYPKDAISHIEIARLYLLLGQKDHAEAHVKAALLFDSNNRFVVRAAARFYVHEKREDKAQEIIRASRLLRRDPWLIAADVSISQLQHKTSREIKKGMEMIESGNYSNFELTELCSAIGTQEMIDGAYTKSRRLFNKSLNDPNDNSVAQAQWVIKKNNFELEGMARVVDSERCWEANAYRYFAEADYAKALKYAKLWIDNEQYSTRATMYAYRIASTYLDDLNEGENIMRNSLIANRGNKSLINDYAYTLALNGHVEEAEKQIAKAKITTEDNYEVRICLIATKGLIAFRNNDIPNGHKQYTEAIYEAIKYPKHPYLYCSAMLNYCREIMLYDASESNVAMVKTAMAQLSEAEVIEENRELQQIKIKVEEILARQK